MQTNNYSRQQVEEMLPDYVFGNLTAAESAEFERAVQGYPEVQREIEEVRKVFSQVEKMDINGMIDQHTRNLSMKVNQRMAAPPRRSKRATFFAWGLPALVGAAAFVIMFYVTPKPDSGSIEEDIAALISKDADKLPLKEISESGTFPIAVLPHVAPVQASSQAMSESDNDNLDALLAESVTLAAEQPGDADFIETERLHLQNTIDINDVEQMIKELDDEAG